MTAHRILSDFQRVDIGNGNEEVYLGDPNTNGKVLALSNTVPANNAKGYAKGCIHVHLDETGNFPVRINTGTKAAATFKDVVTRGAVPTIAPANLSETNPANNSVVINNILTALQGHGLIA
jgi:hypothetical protein